MHSESSTAKQQIRDLLLTAFFALAAILINLGLEKLRLPTINMVLIYLFFVVITARYTNGYIYGVLSAVSAVLSFNYIFFPPRYSLAVFSSDHGVTFAVMFVIALYMSTLTSHVKAEEEQAKSREASTTLCYQMTRKLTLATTQKEIIRLFLEFVDKLMDCKCSYLPVPDDCKPIGTVIQLEGDSLQEVDTDGPVVLTEGPQPENGQYLIGNQFYSWKIEGRDKLYGYLCIPKEAASHLTQTYMVQIGTLSENVSLAMEHLQTLKNREMDRQEASQERFRGNLLRSISHDLRTPLTGIIGTSELIMNLTEDNPEIHTLASNIHHESSWLRSLVQNILSLTRLQGGSLHIKKELQVVEEIVDAALQSMRLRYPNRNFIFNPPDDVITAKMDSKLFQQVLINLMDNANKHTPPGGAIQTVITENPVDQTVSVSIIDSGCGLREADFNKIFTIFYTTHANEAENVRGFGLGLPICDSIAKAHGGTITAQNNTDGPGATFTITIPQD